MLRIIKVTGESLSPTFREGDYVVLTTIPFFLRQIKTGDFIVFKRLPYGTMIKKVAALAEDGGGINVIGTHENSVDSRQFGSIPAESVVGKVIWHISRPEGRKPPISPILVILLGILAVSTASIFIRYAQAYAPSLTIAAYRLTISALVLTPLAIKTRRAELSALSSRDIFMGACSGIFLALHFATWITSLEYTSVASSVVFVTTTPLWVALLAPFTLKEPLTRLVLMGMALALGGGIVVGLSDSCTLAGGAIACPEMADFIQGKAFFGDLLALFGAWMAAAYVLIGRSLRSKLSLISYIFLVYGVAAIVLLVIMISTRQNPWGYPPIAYLWFTLLALVPQLLGHSSFNWALGYLSAAYVSIALLGEPIGSTILAFFLLGEKPAVLKVFGAILILLGIYLASRSETKINAKLPAHAPGNGSKDI